MSYRIIADSCCDKTALINTFDNITFVPLTLSIGDYTVFDDENFDQDDFVRRMEESSLTAKTACPSPEAWANAFDCEEDDLYVITITDKLSGTYNSAARGKSLFEEETGKKKNIHIFNSLATSGLESLAVEKIKELADSGAPFEEVTAKIEDFILNHTALYFCLESLDVLKNNGRLFALAGAVLKRLRLKLVCERTKEGNIKLAGQEIATNRALAKMASIIANDVKDCDLSDKKIVISHVCCPEKAQLISDKISALVSFGTMETVKASGLNSVYASNGGIIVSYSK